jgi:apolipoprotein N-acyltransferase
MRNPMLRTLCLAFLAGVMGANALPHFLSGITAREYPNLTGNSAVRNGVAGWAGLVIAGALLLWSDAGAHHRLALVALALGAMVMVVFHAGGGAYRLNTRFGRPNPSARER